MPEKVWRHNDNKSILVHNSTLVVVVSMLKLAPYLDYNFYHIQTEILNLGAAIVTDCTTQQVWSAVIMFVMCTDNF
jgi:hypothetical protein